MEKPRYILGVLLILVTIITAQPNQSKVIGFTPPLKEENVDKLLHLILHEADLIKLAAYKKLYRLSKRENIPKEEEKVIVPALIKSSVELIKYYGTCTNVKATREFSRGKSNVQRCLNIMITNEEKGNCYKLEAMLFQAYFFTHKIKIHRFMRKWLNSAKERAFELLKTHDEELNFFDIKLSCELKFFVQDNPCAFRIWTGDTHKEEQVDCVSQLLIFKDKIDMVGTYTGEYFYLLGRAYRNKYDTTNALKYLWYAIQSVVFDNKSRMINAHARKLFTKLYMKKRVT